jgi:hypothetical protein
LALSLRFTYADINAGDLYFDVQSAWDKPGEIRAQINPILELYDRGISVSGAMFANLRVSRKNPQHAMNVNNTDTRRSVGLMV